MAYRILKTKPYWRCERCGAAWTGRDMEKPPIRCANALCRSPYWRSKRKQAKHAR